MNKAISEVQFRVSVRRQVQRKGKFSMLGRICVTSLRLSYANAKVVLALTRQCCGILRITQSLLDVLGLFTVLTCCLLGFATAAAGFCRSLTRVSTRVAPSKSFVFENQSLVR